VIIIFHEVLNHVGLSTHASG